MEFFKHVLSPDFMPHGCCYLWGPRIVWLHVISDGLITLSYYCIPAVLIYFIRKNRDIPFHRIFWMFGTFILACGTTHLMEIWNVWHGSYLLAGAVKGITAAVSVITVAMLIPLVPRVISLPGRIHLQEANRKLDQDITERERAMDVRRRLAAVVESSDDAIISKTLEGTITAWNPGAEKLFGYSSSEAVGKPMRMLFPSECMNEESDILARIGCGERVDHFESVWVRKDSKKISVSATVSPIKDRSGAIVGASTIARDITERQQAEQTVKESLATSKAALKELADQKFALDQHAIVAVTDVQGTITYVNEKFCVISQYSKEELIGQNHRILNSGHHSKEFFQQMYNTIADGKVWHGEIKNRAKDGSIYWVDTTIVPFVGGDGKPRQYVAIRADITERKSAGEALAGLALELSRQATELVRSQQALEAQTLMLQSVLDGISEGLVAADEEGKFVLWNPAAEKIVGLGAANVSSEEWTEHYGLFLPDTVTRFPAEQNPLARAIRGEASTAEMFVRNPALEKGVWIEASASPLKNKDGAPRGGVVAFRDITQSRADEREIRKLNDELEQRVVERTAQLETANKELEAFSYSVSHDLRAPLRHIGGFSKLLAEEFGSTLDPTAQHYLDRIQSGTQKMGLLVDELLALARVGRQALNRQAISLNSIVEEVIAILKPESEGRQVEWVISNLPLVQCDPVLVKQIFQNLLANALKFTRGRAPSIIEISHRENTDDGQRVYMVRDNGIGFNMKYVDKLFGVFQRLHRAEDFEGTGVGLATAQRIVQKHGGRVWAEGEVDKGAAFYFTLGTGKQVELKNSAATAGGQS
jgi:PAS domain S-box-containing protein